MAKSKNIKAEYVVDGNTGKKLNTFQPKIFSRTQKDAKELFLKDNPNQKVYNITRTTTDDFKKKEGGHIYRVTGVNK